MKLTNAARHADTTLLKDAYTGANFAMGQISTFIDSNVDGSISQRRVLSIAPGIAILPRRAVTYAGERWLLGDTTTDMYKGVPIRQSIAGKKVTDAATILTPAQACLNAVGLLAYTQKVYWKDTVNPLTDSQYDPYYQFYFAYSEPVGRGSFLKLGSTFYRARTAYKALEGHAVAAADELDPDAFVVATLNSEGAYNPVTDSASGVPIGVTAIRLDMYKLNMYQTQADPRNQAGDLSLLVAKVSATPVAGQTVTIDAEVWRILTITSEQDAWLLHIRRA